MYFGLSPDFSVQLEVSLSESLSKRLNQKLKSPIIVGIVNRQYECDSGIISRNSIDNMVITTKVVIEYNFIDLILLI